MDYLVKVVLVPAPSLPGQHHPVLQFDAAFFRDQVGGEESLFF